MRGREGGREERQKEKGGRGEKERNRSKGAERRHKTLHN